MKNHRIVPITDPSSNPVSVIIMLAFPIFLEQVLVTLVQAVDTAMVGSLGAVATASVSISQNPIDLINAVLIAMGVGFTTLIARAVGAQKYEYSRHLLRQALLLVLVLGIPLSVLTFAVAGKIPQWLGAEQQIWPNATAYVQIVSFSMLFRGLLTVLTAIYRGFGDSRTPMLINVGINISNIVGNFFLIYETREISVLGQSFTVWGAGLGVPGAALSTTISATLGSLLLLGLCFLPNAGLMRISLKEDYRPDPDTLKKVAYISLPVMFERFSLSGAFVMNSAIIASLGTVSLAANSLAGQTEALSFMPGFAFGTAVTTLVAQCLGANNETLARKYVRISCIIGSCVMAVMTFVLYFLGETIVSFFTPDAEVIALGGVLLHILALIQIPQMIGMLFSSVLKGGGDTRSPFLITLFSMWGVRILGSFLAVKVFHKDLPWVCAITCLDVLVRFFLYTFKYFQGHWTTAAQNSILRDDEPVSE